MIVSLLLVSFHFCWFHWKGSWSCGSIIFSVGSNFHNTYNATRVTMYAQIWDHSNKYSSRSGSKKYIVIDSMEYIHDDTLYFPSRRIFHNCIIQSESSNCKFLYHQSFQGIYMCHHGKHILISMDMKLLYISLNVLILNNSHSIFFFWNDGLVRYHKRNFGLNIFFSHRWTIHIYS